MTEPEFYLQHPSNAAIEFLTQHSALKTQDYLPLGLICNQDEAYAMGTEICIKHPQLPDDLPIKGIVVWCRRQNSGYQVGLGFRTEEDLYRIRMFEQLCHIQLYQKEMRSSGRKISTERAAQEWIEEYAAHFPSDGL